MPMLHFLEVSSREMVIWRARPFGKMGKSHLIDGWCDACSIPRVCAEWKKVHTPPKWTRLNCLLLLANTVEDGKPT